MIGPTVHHIDSNGATCAYVIPAHELLSEPRREWDPERRHYRRERCAYCLSTTFVFGQEAETGRYFCGICTKRHGFKVRVSCR